MGIRIPSQISGSINVTLESPEAAPFVLAALVIYLGYRLSVEWYQVHPARRALRAARADYWVTHLIGVASLAVFVVQLATGGQIVAFVELLAERGLVGDWRYAGIPAIGGAVVGFLLGSYARFVYPYGPPEGMPRGCLNVMGVCAAVAAIASLLVWGSATAVPNALAAAGGYLGGMIAGIATGGSPHGPPRDESLDDDPRPTAQAEVEQGSSAT